MGIPGKLNLILISVGLVVLLVAGGINYLSGMRKIDLHLNNKVKVVSDRLKVSLPNSVFEYDMDTLQATVRAEFPDNEVEAILVYQADGELVFGMARKNGVSVEVRTFKGASSLVSYRATLLVADESYQEVMGWFDVFLSRSNAESKLVWNTVHGVLALCLGVAVMVFLLGYVVNRYLVSPLEAIRLAMVKTSEAVRKADVQTDWQGSFSVQPLKNVSVAFSELYEMESCYVEMGEAIRLHQKALSDSEKHLRRIFNATSEAIIVRDAETGVICDANDAMLDMYGYDKDEIYALSVMDMVYDQSPEVEELITEKLRLTAVEGPQLLELRVRHKSGKPFWVEIALKYYQTTDGNRFLAVERDITVRKEQESELRKYRNSLETQVQERTRELKDAQQELVKQERLALLGQLNATVSHEIRNPLGTIANALCVIEEASATGELTLIEKALSLANRNIERCDRIISELLDFSRQRELECVPTLLDEWVAKELADYKLPEGIHLQCVCRSGLMVNFDGERLRRVLMNVLDNATQAMQEQDAFGKRLSLETRAGKKTAEIIIVDEGSGISVENKAKIFEPLFSTKGFGVGLGMVVVKNILEQHGGGIDIVSSPGHGTRVTLWLPTDKNGRWDLGMSGVMENSDC